MGAQPAERRTAADLVASGRVLLIGHRGNSRKCPENTLPSFQSALALGVDLVELDYRHTADGVPVVLHDSTLDRTTDAPERWGGRRLPLSRHRAAELKVLSAGSWFSSDFAAARVPTLAQALELICPQALTAIERKSGNAAALIKLLRGRGWLKRVVVMAFDYHFLADCHRLAPELTLAALGAGKFSPRRLDRARTLGATIQVWDQRETTRGSIAAIHAAGLKAWVFTVNDPRRAAELLAWGIDGLISDIPGEIRAVLGRTSRKF